MISQLPVDDPGNYFAPLSFYGAPTDGTPLTRITPSDGMLLFSTGAALGVRFQDLEIRAHAVRFTNAPTDLIAPTGLVPDTGLQLQNVHFIGQESLALGQPAFNVRIGSETDQGTDYPVRSPQPTGEGPP